MRRAAPLPRLCGRRRRPTPASIRARSAATVLNRSSQRTTGTSRARVSSSANCCASTAFVPISPPSCFGCPRTISCTSHVFTRPSRCSRSARLPRRRQVGRGWAVIRSSSLTARPTRTSPRSIARILVTPPVHEMPPPAAIDPCRWTPLAATIELYYNKNDPDATSPFGRSVRRPGEASVRRRLLGIYRHLYRRLGPQGWWPGRTRFEIIVGAILTQNTNWANVEKAIGNLRRARLLDPVRMSALPARRLAPFVRPAGTFAVKARRLRNFLAFLHARYGGSLPRVFP